MKIPEPCEDSNRAAGRIKTMRSKLLGELETILTTSVLVLEKHDFLAKAKKYRKLYRHYFPRKNLEKEFEKKYLKP